MALNMLRLFVSIYGVICGQKGASAYHSASSDRNKKDYDNSEDLLKRSTLINGYPECEVKCVMASPMRNNIHLSSPRRTNNSLYPICALKQLKAESIREKGFTHFECDPFLHIYVATSFKVMPCNSSNNCTTYPINDAVEISLCNIDICSLAILLKELQPKFRVSLHKVNIKGSERRCRSAEIDTFALNNAVKSFQLAAANNIFTNNCDFYCTTGFLSELLSRESDWTLDEEVYISDKKNETLYDIELNFKGFKFICSDISVGIDPYCLLSLLNVL